MVFSLIMSSGPTHEKQPIYSWNAWNSPHFGQPNQFNFSWIEF